jgi:hypothetical protein
MPQVTSPNDAIQSENQNSAVIIHNGSQNLLRNMNQ